MKKLLTMMLVFALAISMSGNAFALKFTGELGNQATFETLAEAHTNSSAVVQGIVENGSKTFVGHPVLDGYPEGTTFVYRSANQYAGRAAARLNTNIITYVDKHFATKDEAFAYLKEAGLIDVIDEAIGSVVLVTPIGEAFDRADVASYYALQTAMLAQKAGGKDVQGNAVSYSDAEYFGGYGYVYFVGIDGGATFFNNYLSPEIDFAGRIAGALLIGGDMQEIRKPSIIVPVYLVNNKEEIIKKYQAINLVDAIKREGGLTTYYNQAWPLRKVVTETVAEINLAAHVKSAYYGLFVKAMRVPVLPQAIYSGGTSFSGYNFDEAPYSLCNRNIIINGKTTDGIHLIKHQMDDNRFSEFKTTQDVTGMDGSVTPAGEYIDVWYEYLPEEVLNNTAPAGTVPLILANHGGGDDARVFVEEFGLLKLAGKERIALVAPDHQLIAEVRGPALTAVVNYMLETYPALDASRVYATGYSMGGAATYTVGYYSPKLFAAVAPMSGSPTNVPENLAENFERTELPVIFGLSSFDGVRRMDALEGNLNEASQQMVTYWAKNNGIELTSYDFDTYPHIGFGGDVRITSTVNDEFEMVTTYLKNGKGEPRVAFAFVKGMIHALYPEYAFILWDFVKDYSRNLSTGEVIYNP